MSAINRRSFIKVGVASVGSLYLSVPLVSRFANANAEGIEPATSSQWCVYVSIHPDNRVTMVSPVMEMGQFMRTAGPMILADEMDLDWSLISFSSEVPVYMKRDDKGELGYDHAPIGTGGSQTLKSNWDYLRKAGALVRRMLIEEAATRWSIDTESLTARNSHVLDPKGGRSFSYGELAAKAALREVNVNKLVLKTKAEYRIMGQGKGTIDVHSIITGKPLFGIDEDYQNALQAVIDRAPAMGAEIAGYNKQAALAIPGVRQILEIERESGEHWLNGETQIVAAGVAVLADSLWAAMKGKAALNTRWKNTSLYAQEDSETQLAEFRRQVGESNEKGAMQWEAGDVDRAFAEADLIVEQTWEKPLLAHMCMEPLNCLADVRSDSATIVVGHQWPHRAAQEVERITGIDALRVEIYTKRMGGGFGRKAEVDFLREAIILSYKSKRPVKVTWTRENDAERDYFEPASVMRARAALKDKKVTAWYRRHVQTAGRPEGQSFPIGVVANHRLENLKSSSKIPVGPWRGPMQLQWAFSFESMMDELAYAAGEDPLAFRLQLMQPHKSYPLEFWAAKELDSGRMAACYQRAAEMADWQRKRLKGTGLGLAGHFTFGSYVAFVLEVQVSEANELTLRNAWGAIDCGFAVNPNHVRSQMEGGFIDGLNAALFNKVIIKNARVQTTNFDTLRWMRMREAPLDVEVSIIANDHEPTGVGEPPVAPAAAALTNAIYAACGKRIRRMPVAESFTI